jgi:hypothetical protein
MLCRSQSGEGSSEFRAFDSRLGTTVVLHADEKRGVVFVATGLLDGVSGGCCPCFREQRIAFRTSRQFRTFAGIPSEPGRGEKRIGRVRQVPIEVRPVAFRESPWPAVSMRAARFIIVIFHGTRIIGKFIRWTLYDEPCDLPSTAVFIFHKQLIINS